MTKKRRIYRRYNRKLRQKKWDDGRPRESERTILEEMYDMVKGAGSDLQPDLTHRVHPNTIKRAIEAHMARTEKKEYADLRKRRRKPGGLNAVEEAKYQEMRKRARKHRKVKKKPGLHLKAWEKYMEFALRVHREKLEALSKNLNGK